MVLGFRSQVFGIHSWKLVSVQGLGVEGFEL